MGKSFDVCKPGVTSRSAAEHLEGSPSARPEPETPRKPYQRPSVQKRRSLTQATLVSGGGTGGALVGGSP